jgi:hypothetical protein
MNLLVIILLVLLLCGGGGFYGFNSYRAGWGIPGGIGLVVVVLLILFLTGTIR